MEPSTETLQTKTTTTLPEQRIRDLHMINGALLIIFNLSEVAHFFNHKPHIALPELLLINAIWIFLWRRSVLTERNYIERQKEQRSLSQAEVDAITQTQKSNHLLFTINIYALSLPVLMGVILLVLTSLGGGDKVDNIKKSTIFLNVPLTIAWAITSIIGYFVWKQNKALGIITTLLVPLYSCFALYLSLK